MFILRIRPCPPEAYSEPRRGTLRCMITSAVDDILGVLALAVAATLIATGTHVLLAGRLPRRGPVLAHWRTLPPRQVGLQIAGASLVPALAAVNWLTHNRWALIFGSVAVLALVATVVGWLAMTWKHANGVRRD